MNNSDIISEATILYDRIRVQELTGSYGKAKVLDTVPTREQTERLKLFVELLGTFQAYGAYLSGLLHYKVRRITDPESKKALKNTAYAIKRAFGNISFRLIGQLYDGDFSYLRSSPMLSEEKLVSSVGVTTAIAHASKLVFAIENGKTDYLTTISQEIMKLMDESYNLNASTEKLLNTVELSDEFKTWAQNIPKPIVYLDFAGSRKSRTIFTGRVINYLKLSAVDLNGEDIESDNVSDGIYLSSNTIVAKKLNNVVYF